MLRLYKNLNPLNRGIKRRPNKASCLISGIAAHTIIEKLSHRV